MSGYYKSSRKRKGQGAHYHKTVTNLSGWDALYAGPGYTGVVPAFINQRYLLQTTTSFRSGRDGRDEIQPASLLLKNQQENQKASIYDNGHPFETRDEKLYMSHPRVTLRGTSGSFYEGPLFGTDTGGPGLNWPASWAGASDFTGCHISADDLTYGTRAMNNVAPDISPSHLLQALAELKQDFPRVPLLHSHQKLKRVPKDNLTSKSTGLGPALGLAADETLNYFFGVAPTLKDLYQVLNSVIRCGKLVDQWRRDAGRSVRRSVAYDPIVTNVDVRSGSTPVYRVLNEVFRTNSITPWTTALVSDPSENVLVSRNQTRTDLYKFVGAFTYYIDPILDRLGPAGVAFNNAQHLLGLSADANTIWQLTPWTWLIDWFVNLGDCISLMNRIQDKSLVLRYGYLLRETEEKITLTVDRLTTKGGMAIRDIRTDSVVRRKVRIRSTPYGFGLSTAGFSPVQWAILAALGFTSGEHQLRYL
jgi:hypothetical protein